MSHIPGPRYRAKYPVAGAKGAFGPLQRPSQNLQRVPRLLHQWSIVQNSPEEIGWGQANRRDIAIKVAHELLEE